MKQEKENLIRKIVIILVVIVAILTIVGLFFAPIRDILIKGGLTSIVQLFK